MRPIIKYVYAIKNCTTNKLYIGSSKNIYQRLLLHFNQLNHGNHPNNRLQADHQKSTKYEVYILDIIPNESIFSDREYWWMLKYNTYDPNYGYNDKDISKCVFAKSEIEGERVYMGLAQNYAKDTDYQKCGIGWHGKLKQRKTKGNEQWN